MKEPLDLFYTIDGGDHWAVVGRSKVKIDIKEGRRFSVEIRAVPVKFGCAQVPQVRIVGRGNVPLDPRYVVKERGNMQMVTVRPGGVVIARKNKIRVFPLKHSTSQSQVLI